MKFQMDWASMGLSYEELRDLHEWCIRRPITSTNRPKDQVLRLYRYMKRWQRFQEKYAGKGLSYEEMQDLYIWPQRNQMEEWDNSLNEIVRLFREAQLVVEAEALTSEAAGDRVVHAVLEAAGGRGDLRIR